MSRRGNWKRFTRAKAAEAIKAVQAALPEGIKTSLKVPNDKRPRCTPSLFVQGVGTLRADWTGYHYGPPSQCEEPYNSLSFKGNRYSDRTRHYRMRGDGTFDIAKITELFVDGHRSREVNRRHQAIQHRNRERAEAKLIEMRDTLGLPSEAQNGVGKIDYDTSLAVTHPYRGNVRKVKLRAPHSGEEGAFGGFALSGEFNFGGLTEDQAVALVETLNRIADLDFALRGHLFCPACEQGDGYARHCAGCGGVR